MCAKSNMQEIVLKRKKLLSPVLESEWASKMVLNPSIIQDPDSGRIHMLFRATGPWEFKRIEGKPIPYPIFLGYGFSDDNGENWTFDTKTPALAPALAYNADEIFIQNIDGDKVVNYTNGCIEDPRFCKIDDEIYLTAACRMFPPGPYWEKDDPMQCAPEWATEDNHPFGDGAKYNHTVTVLYKVDLKALEKRQYHKAFLYVTNLTDPAYGQDRDVVFLPKRQNIGGKRKIVMIQRPVTPNVYPYFEEEKPSIVVAYAENFQDFKKVETERYILASPLYDWEEERIGASTQPLEVGDDLWLLNYHGKKDGDVGYTQSFMLLRKNENKISVIARPDERMITVTEPWEMPNKFKIPCIFSDGMIRIGDKLLLSYGAADEVLGIMELDYKKLIDYLYI